MMMILMKTKHNNSKYKHQDDVYSDHDDDVGNEYDDDKKDGVSLC